MKHTSNTFIRDLGLHLAKNRNLQAGKQKAFVHGFVQGWIRCEALNYNLYNQTPKQPTKEPHE